MHSHANLTSKWAKFMMYSVVLYSYNIKMVLFLTNIQYFILIEIYR